MVGYSPDPQESFLRGETGIPEIDMLDHPEFQMKL
jgi:hypothetical protein